MKSYLHTSNRLTIPSIYTKMSAKTKTSKSNGHSTAKEEKPTKKEDSDAPKITKKAVPAAKKVLKVEDFMEASDPFAVHDIINKEKPKKKKPVKKEEEEEEEEEERNKEKDEKAPKNIEEAVGACSNMMGAKQGVKLTKKQKEQVLNRTYDVLEGRDPDEACIVYIKDILHLAAKHSEHLANGKYTTQIRSYRREILPLMRKGEVEKTKLAKKHTGAFKELYKKFKKEILELELDWLETAGDIHLTYQKKHLLPLSELYIYLHSLDTEEGILVSRGLEYRLWCIFAHLADNEADSKTIAAHASEVNPGADIRVATEEVAKKAGGKTMDTLPQGEGEEFNQVFGTVGQIMGKLANDAAMKEVVRGAIEKLQNDTFDAKDLKQTVADGVVAAQQEKQQEEEEEEQDD